jgi:hypothetical protein
MNDPIEELFYTMIHGLQQNQLSVPAWRLSFILVHSGIKLGLETIIKHLEESKDIIRDDLPNFVGYCLAWSHGLSTHHKLEVCLKSEKYFPYSRIFQEEFIFPVLNRQMDFSGEKDAHDVVHDKIDSLEAMLRELQADHSKFNPDHIREHLLATKEPLVSLNTLLYFEIFSLTFLIV